MFNVHVVAIPIKLHDTCMTQLMRGTTISAIPHFTLKEKTFTMYLFPVKHGRS